MGTISTDALLLEYPSLFDSAIPEDEPSEKSPAGYDIAPFSTSHS